MPGRHRHRRRARPAAGCLVRRCCPPDMAMCIGGLAVPAIDAGHSGHYHRTRLDLSGNTSNSMTRKIIIDTDPGQDDAVAILLALASPEELEVLGIIAVAGNVRLALNARNALKVVEL